MPQSKRVLITGGTTGIGFATAKLFVEDGHKVMITGRTPKTLDAARAELGDDVEVVASDAGDTGAIGELFAHVQQVWGGLDVLFLNAGRGASMLPLAQMAEEQWDSVMSINLRGPVFAIKAAIPLMAAGSSIIVNTSIANEMGGTGHAAYGASKAALRSLVRSAASELAESGIRVNAVSPGPITTPIWDKAGLPEDERGQMLEQFRQLVPQKRFGEPSEVATVVRFFASDDASYVTGTELRVAGGLGDC